MQSLDAYLLARPPAVKYAAIAVTFVVMLLWSLPHVPRAFVDYSRWPWLSGIEQPDQFGTDTIADTYASKVILNDPADMYTRERLEQTPLEAETWSKAASSPYPPLTLLALTALYAAGEATGLQLYGMVLVLAGLFLLLSAIYFLWTRWYIFPLLYLNFAYFAERFVEVQDGSYLVMLNIVIVAMLVATSRRATSHVLMAVSIALKLLPLYHLSQLPEMTRRTRAVVLAVLAAGFVLPYVVWDNYLYIYTFNAGNKGDLMSALGGLAVAAPVAWLIWRLERRGVLDAEERIGWALVPLALFLAIKTNAARHLLIALLVPDKRGVRNIAAAIALLLVTLAPSVFRLGSATYVSTVVLIVWLVSASGRKGRN